jgi:methyltransferase
LPLDDLDAMLRDLQSPLWVALVVVVFLLLETIRASRNERRQRAAGGIEPAHDVYHWMQLAYPGGFAAMLAEGVFRWPVAGEIWWIGAVLFAGGKAIKWWAILTLGQAWTFRVIVVPGGTLVRSGPYRWLAHPNYVGVVGELAGVAFLSGARVTGPIACLLFGVLLWRRIALESRWLDAILRGS